MPRQVPILKCRYNDRQQEFDVVAEEEALAIEVNGGALTLTMRTPGEDDALAVGLLYSEGIIQRYEDIDSIDYRRDEHGLTDRGTLKITLIDSQSPLPATGWERRFPSTSSCGVCGKADRETLRATMAPFGEMKPLVAANAIYSMSAEMRRAQRDFIATGGLHAAALFDTEGKLVRLCEDIGRHNAVDKLIGHQLMEGRLPLSNCVMMTSGRASFEIVQKAATARVPVLCAVSAPSSLAVRMAHDMNMTLIGFLRGEGMNIYSGAMRIIQDPSGPPGCSHTPNQTAL